MNRTELLQIRERVGIIRANLEPKDYVENRVLFELLDIIDRLLREVDKLPHE